MNISVQPGTYVVAVSGGVDSMVLLDLLRQHPGIKLVVAHYDHGIRPNSMLDRQLVQQTAHAHGLPFVYHEGDLGPGVSEEVARKARYQFLHQVRQASGARAVITAHHHNDALETAVINLLRGTGRRGLTSLRSRAALHRPLLHIPKQQLRQYAQDQGLTWHEDSTNQDNKYARNYVRNQLLTQFSEADRAKLAEIVQHMHQVNDELDEQLAHYLHVQPAVDRLDRKRFVMLPHAVAKEVLASWLRNHGVRQFDQKTLERLAVAGKTYAPGRLANIVDKYWLRVDNDHLALERPDR